MKINIIVACTPSGGIGFKNKLPWENLPGDLKFFKEITMGYPVVMGRNTFESIHVRSPDGRYKPEDFLPGRKPIIISSSPIEGFETVPTFEDVNEPEIYVIGGGMLYNHVIENYFGELNYVIVTEVFKEYLCDTFFPIERFWKVPRKILKKSRFYTIKEYYPRLL